MKNAIKNTTKQIECYQVAAGGQAHIQVVQEHIQAVPVDNQLAVAVDNLVVAVDNLAEAVDNHRTDLEVAATEGNFPQEEDTRILVVAVPCLTEIRNDNGTCLYPSKQNKL